MRRRPSASRTRTVRPYNPMPVPPLEEELELEHLFTHLYTYLPPRQVFGPRSKYSAFLPRPRIVAQGKTTEDVRPWPGLRALSVPYSIQFPSPSTSATQAQVAQAGGSPRQETYERDSRRSIAMASVEQERALSREHIQRRSVLLAPHRASRLSIHGLLQATSPTYEDPYVDLHQADGHAKGRTALTAHADRMAHGAMGDASPLPRPREATDETTDESIPSITEQFLSFYLEPEEDPPVSRIPPSRLDTLPLDQFIEYRRQHHFHASDDARVAFHLPSGTRDVCGYRGV